MKNQICHGKRLDSSAGAWFLFVGTASPPPPPSNSECNEPKKKEAQTVQTKPWFSRPKFILSGTF